MYWVYFFYQIWNVLKYFAMKLAVSLDLFANASAGEMIEDCVTSREDTLYGKGNWTISAATGKLEMFEKLNKTGLHFTDFLSKCLGENHCQQAYLDEVIKNKIK